MRVLAGCATRRYSQAFGAWGLHGDLSGLSRFIGMFRATVVPVWFGVVV